MCDKQKRRTPCVCQILGTLAWEIGKEPSERKKGIRSPSVLGDHTRLSIGTGRRIQDREGAYLRNLRERGSAPRDRWEANVEGVPEESGPPWWIKIGELLPTVLSLREKKGGGGWKKNRGGREYLCWTTSRLGEGSSKKKVQPR